VSGQPYCYQCGVDREGDWLCNACRPETTDTSDARIAELVARRCGGCRKWKTADCPIEYERDAYNTAGDPPATFGCVDWTARAEEGSGV